MGKVGRRAERQEKKRGGRMLEVQALLQRTAHEQGITLEEARAQLVELAEIRAEHEAKLEGSGMTVQDVRYDPATGNVEVIVKPITIEGTPAGWSPEARARLDVLRGELESDLLAKGRARVAEIELRRTFGEARAGLGALIAQVAPDVVRAASPAPGRRILLAPLPDDGAYEGIS